MWNALIRCKKIIHTFQSQSIKLKLNLLIDSFDIVILHNLQFSLSTFLDIAHIFFFWVRLQYRTGGYTILYNTHYIRIVCYIFIGVYLQYHISICWSTISYSTKNWSFILHRYIVWLLSVCKQLAIGNLSLHKDVLKILKRALVLYSCIF